MKEKLFKRFRQTGKVDDYLKYREEVSKELLNKNDSKKSGDNSKSTGLQGKS